jgi:hypothetical protein
MSIPKDKDLGEYNNDSKNPISQKTTQRNTKVELTKTDINLSTSYLMNVLTEKTNRDADLKKLTLTAEDENIIISLPESDFNDQLAPKLAAVLKPISNDISLFTGKLDMSYKIASILKQNDMDKNIAIMESAPRKGKIDFVIYP